MYESLIKKDEDFFEKNYFKFAAIAACILVSCRKNNVPLTFKQMSELSTEKLRNIKKWYRKIITYLGLDIPLSGMDLYIAEILNKFNYRKRPFSEDFKKRVRKICNFLEKEMNISGKDPKGYIAAVLYLYGKEKYKLKMGLLASKIGISLPTVSDRVFEVKKFIKKVKKS